MGDTMSYAYVVAGVIQSEGGLPQSARRIDTSQWVMGLREYATVALQQACGWFAVVDVARPADTPTTTTDRSVALVAGVPTVVWTQRPWTPDELAARTQGANRTTLSDEATLVAKLGEIKSFLVDVDIEASANRANTVAPTTQELNRTLKALIRQERRAANMLIRLARHRFGDEHPALFDDITDV
jgi:hypothetical protein